MVAYLQLWHPLSETHCTNQIAPFFLLLKKLYQTLYIEKKIEMGVGKGARSLSMQGRRKEVEMCTSFFLIAP